MQYPWFTKSSSHTSHTSLNREGKIQKVEIYNSPSRKPLHYSGRQPKLFFHWSILYHPSYDDSHNTTRQEDWCGVHYTYANICNRTDGIVADETRYCMQLNESLVQDGRSKGTICRGIEDCIACDMGMAHKYGWYYTEQYLYSRRCIKNCSTSSCIVLKM